MADKHLTFSGGLILGAGLICLFNAKRGRRPHIAGAIGVAVIALGARLIARLGERESSTTTARDLDVPNYAWLR